MKRMLTTIMCVFLLTFAFPSTVYADDGIHLDLCEGSILFYNGGNGNTTISQGANRIEVGENKVFISQSSFPGQTENTISILSCAVAFELSNTNIFSDSSTISLDGDAKLLLTIAGTNIFKSQNGAGIAVPAGSELTITGTGGLTITSGTGSAGIGGVPSGSVGKITIESGILDITGSGSGIGGAAGRHTSSVGYDNGTVIISGGQVTATAKSGAGIGGGAGFKYGGSGGTITITNGTVTATGSSGAGIGGAHDYQSGKNGGSSGIIEISGGIVNATGHSGIGACENNADRITIIDGDITAIGNNGAGIGGGAGGDGGTIVICGGTIEAKSTTGAGIGGGSYSSQKSPSSAGGSGSVAISGGNITAISTYGAGVGAGGANHGDIGKGGNGDRISITGGEVTAQSTYGAGIGGGGYGNNTSGGNSGLINITGGKVIATSAYGSGIGGGDEGDAETISISDAIVEARSTQLGAGIGGGNKGKGGSITITNSKINASCGYNNVYGGSGIGGGLFGSGGLIRISKCDLTVEGYWHAIGGGGKDNTYGCELIALENNVSVAASHTNPDGSDYQEQIKLNSDVTDAAALSGNNGRIEVSAYCNSAVTYQWQTSPDNVDWTNISGQTESFTLQPISSQFYRCRIINAWGNEILSSSGRVYELTITKQPQSLALSKGQSGSTAITTSSEYVVYQWQKSYDEGQNWADVPSQTSNILTVDGTPDEHESLYRCVITASNGDNLVSDIIRVVVTGISNRYFVRYYCEKANDNGYELYEQVAFEAEAGEYVTAAEKTYYGFTEQIDMGIISGTVKSDNSLTLSRYYDRNCYTITYETNGGTAIGSASLKYGAVLSLPTPNKIGCTFGGWYSDAALSQAFTDTTMPGENLKLYAKWNVVGAGRSIEYKINGITLRDSSYQSITAIPRGTFYAEVSVTNLSSTTMDTLLLATYDANGRMLGLSFLYANPQIGQTFVLGTSFDNSKGEIAKIKAFMLPMLGGLTPLAEAVEYGG